MGHQFSTPTGLAGGARALALQYQAETEDAGKPGAAINDALQALANALASIPTAQAKAAEILNDPRLNQPTKVADARAVVSTALDAAKAAGAAYTQALDDAQAALSATLVPKMPSGTDGALLAFRAAECVKLLEAAGGGSSVINMAAQLLADALAAKDAVKAYIISGDVVLRDTYQRLGVDAGDLRARLAKVIGKSAGNGGDSVPGAQLLALLAAGGPGTYRGFDVWVKNTLYTEQGNYDRSLSAYVAIGAVQGLNMGPFATR